MWWMVVAGVAEAKDPNWGVGAHVGTWAIPGQYPSLLPKVDVDGDGTNEPMASVEKVGGDFMFGAEGWFWVDDQLRLGLVPTVDLGSKYTDVNALLVADFVFADGDQLDVYAGGGVGAGVATFRGTQGDEKLVVPNYPLRAEIGGMLAVTDSLAPQLRLIGQWNVPSSHRYTAPNGAELDKKSIGTGLYLNVGVEASFLFGNFKQSRR